MTTPTTLDPQTPTLQEWIARNEAADEHIAELEAELTTLRTDRERLRADAEELQVEVRALIALLGRADSHVSWCLHRHEQKTHFGTDTRQVLERWLADVAPLTRTFGTR